MRYFLLSSKHSKEGRFNADVVTVILNQEKPIEYKITLDGNWVRKMFPKNMTPQQIKDRINQTLDLLEKKKKKTKQL